jgi:glycosyltransferase involved in cell wall biosynthesis
MFDLSIVIIWNKEKEHYLEKCLMTLPEFAEVVLVECRKDSNIGMKDISKEGRFTRAIWNYTEWDYSNARNQAKTLATGTWILMLDSDERLLINQHSQLKEFVERNDNQNTGGAFVTIISQIPALIENQFPKCEVVKAVRLFKNISIFQYKYPVHETIKDSISLLRYEFEWTPLIIHHVGYEVSKDDFINRMNNNINIIWSHPELKNNERYQQYLMVNCATKAQLERI